MDYVSPMLSGGPNVMEPKYAGFWIRAAAALLDGIFLFVIGFLLGIIMFVLGFATVPAEGQPKTIDASDLVGLVIGIAYYTYFHSSKWQATPGKRIIGIHIMHRDGMHVTGLRAFARYWASALSAITLLIGYFMAGWTREKTALHDLICSTRVVYGKL